MSVMHLVLLAAIVSLVVWVGRRIPLAGWRKQTVIACRVAAIGALCAALWGPPRRQTLDVPRQVVYLVDASASIDRAQQEWMARRIASLEALRPGRLERMVVAFGADAQPIIPAGRESLTDPQAILRALDGARIARDQTNFEAALFSTAALLPPDHRSAVVLISDGWETAGNVTGVLGFARRLGLELFSVPTPVFGPSKTLWEELAVPPVVHRGSPVPVALTVFNGSSQPKRGQVTVALEGVTIKRQGVLVRPGWQVVQVPIPTIRRGTMALEVGFAVAQDGVNDHRNAYTEVEGPPQLLFVSDRTTALPALATALKRRDMDIAVAHVADLPPIGGNRLLDSDAVILFNVPKSSLSTEQVDALRTYVETFGGGLLTVGLGGDLAHELATPAPLDALLPVHFEPKGLQEAKRRVCMVLLIDRSTSMIGPRIAATKRAAVELVKQLAPEDLVGILAFDTQPYVVAEVQPAGQISERLVDKLVQLRSSGGTDVFPALAAAAHRLDATGATTKHIILLSDGFTPFQETPYRALMGSLTRSGTTISTIGIGSFINADYLTWLAKSTGGTFYQMRVLDELPRLIARDAQHTLGRLPFAEGYFRPVRSPATEWFSDVPEWPALKGYFTTTARPEARVDLRVEGSEGEEPLLARWTVGQGRVVSFTSDADRRWSPDWIRWPGFDGAWAQVVRWAMRRRLTEELFVWMDEARGGTRLMLEGELHEPAANLLSDDGVTAIPLSLVQVGAWRWSAPIEQVPSGWYQFSLTSQEGGSPVFAKRWVRIGTPPTMTETPGQPPRDAFLRQMAVETQGAYGAPDAAFLQPAATAMTMASALTWWLPLAILALLVEIALRGSTML